MKTLNWSNLLMRERFNAKSYPDDNDYDVRSEFQRDIDRILYTSAFRRLQDKTQVMPLPESDYVRNRLTHTLEVSSVGRSLGKLVGNFVINNKDKSLSNTYTSDDFANIVVAACLAHDIGNPPFGHFGEYSIGNYFDTLKQSKQKFKLNKEEWQDLIQYEGNAEGLRILTSSYTSGLKGGMRLTYATLGAFTKYPCTSVRDNLTKFGKKHYTIPDQGDSLKFRKTLKKVGVFQTELESFNDIAEQLGLIKLSNSNSKQASWCRHPLAFIMEAADTITYHVIDLEDGYKMGIVGFEEAKELFISILRNTHDSRCDINDWTKLKSEDDQIGALRSKVLNSLVHECFEVFKDKYDSIMQGKFDTEIPDLVKSAPILEKIKSEFTNKRVFSHSSVIDVEIAGHKIITTLLDAFVQAAKDPSNKYSIRILAKMPQHYSDVLKDSQASDYTKLLACANYVSRMTDSFALHQYRIVSGDGL